MTAGWYERFFEAACAKAGQVVVDSLMPGIVVAEKPVWYWSEDILLNSLIHWLLVIINHYAYHTQRSEKRKIVRHGYHRKANEMYKSFLYYINGFEFLR